MMGWPSRLRGTLSRLHRDYRGLAMLEFALVLPFFLLLCLTGAELTNYIIVRMRISQLALHLADNAARIGSGTRRETKKIYESDIHDLIGGGQLQSGELDLLGRGRIIISSLEPMAAPNVNKKFRIRWQRCAGAKTAWGSEWGTATTTDVRDGMGPAGRQTIAPLDGVAMFVQVRYQYKPLISMARAPFPEINEIASMLVRDRRDTSGPNDGIYTVSGVTPARC